MTQDPPKKPWEKAAEQSPNAQKPWEKAAVPEPAPAQSFQQPPLPQRGPQQVGGGGGLPTGSAVQSDPSRTPTAPEGTITNVVERQRFTSGEDDMGDAVLMSPVKTGLVPTPQQKEGLRVRAEKGLGEIASTPRSELDWAPPPPMQEGVVPVLDPRWNRVMNEYRAEGQQQFTPNEIAARREAGTWGPREDAREHTRVFDLQQQKINERGKRLKETFEALFKTRDLEKEAAAFEQEGAALEQERAVLEQGAATQQQIDAYNKKATSYQQRQKEYADMLRPINEEGAYLDAWQAYITQGLTNAEVLKALDPRERELLATQMQANADDGSGWAGAGYTGTTKRFFTKLGGNIAASGLRLMNLAGNALNRATGEEDHYSTFAYLADRVDEELERIDAEKPAYQKTDVFSKEWNINPGFLHKLLDGALFAGTLAGAGAQGGARAMTGLAMAASSENYYMEGIESGLKPQDAEAVALLLSGTEASIEALNLGPFVNGNARKSIMRGAVDAIKRGTAPKVAAKESFARYVAAQSAAEAGEGVLTSAAQSMVKRGAEIATGVDQDTELTAQGLAGDALIGGAIGGVMGATGRLSQRPLYKEGVAWAVQNAAEFRQYVAENVPKAEQGPILERFETYEKVYRGLPKGMKSDTRMTVAHAIAEKERLKKERSSTVIDEIVASAIGDMNSVATKEQDEIIADALGVDLVEIAKMNETQRLQEQYDKAKLKSEITGKPMPEGMVRPKEVVIEPEVDSDAIAIAVNDIAASIEDGKKYGVMSDDGSVVDEQQTFDIIDSDYERIRALAEKGRLTTNALAKTSWGRAISSADLGRIANVLNNKPELVDKVFSGIDGRINSRATKPLEEVSDAGDYRIQNRPNQDNPHTNEGGQVQETPGGLGGTTATQEGIQGEVPQGGAEGQGVAPVAAVEGLSKESLKEAFGYSDEVADATIAIADAMGLDKTKIKVVKGGEVGEGALMQPFGRDPLTQNQVAEREELMPLDQVRNVVLSFVSEDAYSEGGQMTVDNVIEGIKEARGKYAVTNVKAILSEALKGAREVWADVQMEPMSASEAAAYKDTIRALEEMASMPDDTDVRALVRTLSPRTERGLRVEDMPLQQDAKGAVEFAEGGDAIIRALKNPDASTGIHELAHVARRLLFDTSIPKENRQGITDEHIKVAEQWSGAKDGNWTREAEEKFARGFERYLRDGNAPTEALKGVFEKFAQWLREIYQNLFTSPVKELVSPEMRRVFDALVTRGVKPQAEEVVEAPPAPPESEPKSTEQSGNFAERATTQKLIKAFPQYADVFTENAINYDRIPHIQSAEEAKALVEAVGIDRLANDIFGDTPMPGHLVSSVAPYIIQEYANRGDADAIALFTEKFAEKMTDAGQMISALNVTYDILANTPGGILMKVARTVEKNRQRQEEQAKKRTDKLAKELGGINKAGITEALKTNKVRTKIAKVSEYQPKTPDDEPSWGAKNKLVTKKKYGEALKAMRGRLASGPITPEMITIAAFHIEAGAREFADVAARVVKTLGKKSLPYLKEAYKQAAKEFVIEPSSDEVIDNYLWEQSAKPIVAKLEKAIKAKDAKAQKEAIGELQSISKESGLWGQYKKQAADRLAMLSEQQIRKDISEDPILAEFTRGLIQNISAQVRELGEQKEQKKAKKQTSISIIADAFKNPEKYKEAWDASREKVRNSVSSAKAEMTKARDSGDEARIKKAKDRLEKAQSRAEALDNYFGEFSPKPFSDAAIKSAVREGMKSLEQKISDIATSHYSVQSSERGKLIDKLMKDAGLSEAEAKELADAIGEEFDRLVTEKKRSLIKSMFSSKQRKKAEVKALEEKVIRMTNLGAFSNDDIVKAYGDAMGFSKLTEENIETIEGLANAIQEAPDGRPKYDAIQDLLNYEATLRGISPWEIADAVFMANILSGPWTHVKNLTAAAFNIAGEYLTSASQEVVKGNPMGAIDLARGLLSGLGHGIDESLSVLRTGRSQVRNRKVEAMNVLELLDKSPSKTQRRIGRVLTGHKFVGRALGAEDTFLHEGGREMRAYKWAFNMARENRDPSMSLRQQALDILNLSDAARQEAIAVAEWELEDEINAIDAELQRGAITPKEHKSRASLARLNYKRRIVEKMESLRPAELRNEAARFGAEATLNSKPYGAMGVVSDKVSSFVRQIPIARRVVPFVNTLSNQANNTLNYTPIGALRAATPGGSVIGWINRKTGGDVKGVEQKMDEKQLAQWKEDVLTKSIIGTTIAAAIYALAAGGDDEEDPWFSITGDGYGDPRKNVELQRLGWQPYSFKFGKTYISYQTSPMMLTMGFLGNLLDGERYHKKQPQDSDFHSLGMALASVPSIFASQSYLSGIEKTLSAALSPRNDDKVSDLSDFLLKSAKSQVEPSIYGEAFRTYQNLSGTANIDTRNSYFGQIVKNWPMARDMYPKQYNFMGEPVIPNITQVITVANSDPAATLSMKNNYVPVSESRTTLSGIDPVTDKERLMTDREADTYYQTRGKEYAKWLRDNYPYLDKLSKKEFQEEASREWMKAGAYAREAAGF